MESLKLTKRQREAADRILGAYTLGADNVQTGIKHISHKEDVALNEEVRVATKEEHVHVPMWDAEGCSTGRGGAIGPHTRGKAVPGVVGDGTGDYILPPEPGSDYHGYRHIGISGGFDCEARVHVHNEITHADDTFEVIDYSYPWKLGSDIPGRRKII